MLLKDAPQKFKDNKNLVIMAVSSCPYALEFASDRLKDDEEVVSIAIQKIGRSLVYASERLKKDKEWIQRAFDANGAAFIVDDEAAKIFNFLDAKMVKECARRRSVDYAGKYYIPDEEKVAQHKIFKRYRDFRS